MPATKKTKTRVLQIRIAPQQLKAIDAVAKRSGLTVPEWVRAVLARAVNERAFAPRSKRTGGA